MNRLQEGIEIPTVVRPTMTVVPTPTAPIAIPQGPEQLRWDPFNDVLLRENGEVIFEYTLPLDYLYSADPMVIGEVLGVAPKSRYV